MNLKEWRQYVQPGEENGRKHPCMMNIFKETNKIVEIQFIHNVRIVTSLCLMIWNRNDCEWWNEHLERWPMFRPLWWFRKESPWNVNTWIDWILLSNIVIN